MSGWNRQSGRNLNTQQHESVDRAALEDEKIESDVKKQNGLKAPEAAGRDITVRSEKQEDAAGPR
ncbi:hypothetical protein CR205_12175 [Alteribacter lacisalsi]|jgi:hypothetical protein|uniref:Uncharacterized protein n=1 Tax=Alteribacter lacisalsi TaxID=2045244 RepID=A0A2W0H8R8_9BACI|nr:hypothetical protein [Alteribacter lacisalsi]PYZ96470.1 hypothetical protein CR205_12175 [Alteribacter lacisalsi]